MKVISRIKPMIKPIQQCKLKESYMVANISDSADSSAASSEAFSIFNRPRSNPCQTPRCPRRSKTIPIDAIDAIDDMDTIEVMVLIASTLSNLS